MRDGFRLLSYGVSKHDHPSVALGRGARADVVVKVGLEEGDGELRAAHNDNGCVGRATQLFYTRSRVPASAGMHYTNALVRARVRNEFFKAFDL